VTDWSPQLHRVLDDDGNVVELTLGHAVLDAYLRFLGACVRPNSWLAAGYDLKVFFSVVRVDPFAVTTSDIFSFITEQRRPLRPGVVRLDDGEAGLSARTIRRRLATLSSFFEYLVAREEFPVARNPVPRGAVRRSGGGSSRHVRGAPLIRTPRTLPRVLQPAEVVALFDALRTERDRTMVAAMVLGGLRRVEVLGLRFSHLHPGDQRLFVAEGKGGAQRVVPIAPQFFVGLRKYLDEERPTDAPSDAVFVVLKGRRRGEQLSAAGVDQILDSARARAGLTHCTCHQLRHTCFTHLREAGMALEAIQAIAGHRSIETTRQYLQLGDKWVATEYLAAMGRIDADLGALGAAR